MIGSQWNWHLTQLGLKEKRPLLAGAVAEVAGGPRELAFEYTGAPAGNQDAAENSGASVTDAVVATFPGSRITSTRLVDHANDPGPEA